MSRITIFCLFLLFVSCNNPLNKKYSEKTLEEDAKAIKESDKLKSDELQLLAGYIIRGKFTNEKLEGLTYAEILAKAKDVEAQQKALADKVAKEAEEKRQRLGAAVNVALYDIGFKKSDFESQDYDDKLQYYMAFENKSSKDIKATRGSLLITDLLGEKIKSLNITFDDGVRAGETYKTVYISHYNQFEDEDKQLRNKTMKEIKFVFTPDKVLFEDGSVLE